MLILRYVCLAFAWLVPFQLFLSYVNLSTFSHWAFIFLYFCILFFTPFSMTCCVVWEILLYMCCLYWLMNKKKKLPSRARAELR